MGTTIWSLEKNRCASDPMMTTPKIPRKHAKVSLETMFGRPDSKSLLVAKLLNATSAVAKENDSQTAMATVSTMSGVVGRLVLSTRTPVVEALARVATTIVKQS